MANRVVIDSDALVGVLRGDPSWAERISQLKADHHLFTTDINAFELYVGAHLSKKRQGNVAAVKGLLNTLTLLNTNEDSMEVAARLAADLKTRGEPLDIKDLLIAAITLVNGAAVLTGNLDHFQRIEGLETVD